MGASGEGGSCADVLVPMTSQGLSAEDIRSKK